MERQAPGLLTTGTIADAGEFGLIDLINSWLPHGREGVAVDIGDDAAALQVTPGKLLLATCDIQVEDRHFRRQYISPFQLGWRSAAVNLSDIGAMGGSPRFALVSLALPKDTPVAWVAEFYRGLREEFDQYGTSVVGGNLSSAGTGIVIDITLLGEGAPEEILRRGGASPGDAILATGSFGASLAGRLALEERLPTSGASVAEAVAVHLTPMPRVKEARAIAPLRLATAMIDVSDGLAADLGHICQASKVGARIHADRIPIAEATRDIARRLGHDPLPMALHGGEDYELIFTAPPSHVETLRRAVANATGMAVSHIGEITPPETGTRLIAPDGREQPLKPLGWDHFRKEPEGKP